MYVKLLLLSMLFSTGVVYASSPTELQNQTAAQALAEKDLEVEIAAEDFFDEEASAAEAKNLEKQYKRKTRDLERKIVNLNSRSRRLQKKKVNLNKRFDQSYQAHQNVLAKANSAEAKTNKISNSVDRLQSRVDKVENKAIAQKNRLRKMKQAYARELRKKQRLNKRKRNAERIIKKYEKQLGLLKRNLSSLSKGNRALQSDIDRKERRAIALSKKARANRR